MHPLRARAPRSRSLRASTARAARAFTLVEIIVVVVILAIAAAAIVPRFMGTARQEADNGIEQVAEIMRLFAFRQSLGAQQVAIWRDGTDGRIFLLVKDADPEDPKATPEWRPDRFAAPVALPDGLEIDEVRTDDKRVSPDEFTIASVPGTDRAKIEIRLVGHGLDTTLVLPAGSPGVVRVDADKPAPFARLPVDLDRSGRGEEPW
ncbi:MAG: prepilin-type N-terminal cleavage/methylation domain-containing protein [Phycisphaerales bacterium]